MPALTKLSRDALNDKAREVGVEGAEELPNRQAVIDAIEVAESQRGGGIHRRGATVISIFGPFASQALVQMSVDLAQELFGDMPLRHAGPTDTTDAVGHDLAAIRERDEELADSALAAVATRLAYELDNPYNSATSKSQCAKALNDILEALRDLAPEEEKEGALDRIAAERQRRLEGGSAAKD